MSSPEAPNGLAAPGPEIAYRVLARKYRPTNFGDLIGQDAMVRTISNAFEAARIPQAWILTGVRGVGKTTTARILARALNYELPDGSISAPTVHMPAIGIHCQAIMESRHPDVIEMDAASHNGVEDVRQINDAIRYAPMSARYKVYILDEVHMLSTQAFNALLKTLEEPPPHAKFVFATTETRKVPVTVLSRCQRFDLRRVDADVLVRHLAGIAAQETITVEPEALALIARAAEGSVRDSLSLLDQAIAHAAGLVRGEDVRQMLGLADRARTIDLFEAVMRGDLAPALRELRDQYDTGADPAVVLSDLAEFTHFVTRVKIVPAVADDLSLAEAERKRGRGFAEKLSIRVLSRAWQMLLKGIAEVEASGRPLAAAEMVLVRLAHAADLPSPDEVIRSLDEKAPELRVERNGGAAAVPSPANNPPRLEAARGAMRGPAATLARPAAGPVAQLSEAAPEAPPLAIGRFTELIELAAQKRDLSVKAALERDVRLVRCEDGRLEIALQPSATRTLVNDLSRKFSQWTGRRWMVVVSAESGGPTVHAQSEARRVELKTGVRADPLVQAVLARFPGAEIVEVREAGAAAPSGREPDGATPEPPPPDDGADYGADWQAGEMDDEP
ncbi:MAG TPA: DNA polymerase III subunit gamma/tau [Xanthobacteraceae bacterium]|nr:DNA polymerase III subunit gamma/tau [Xanthobacteraceae bacterium]